MMPKNINSYHMRSRRHWQRAVSIGVLLLFVLSSKMVSSQDRQEAEEREASGVPSKYEWDQSFWDPKAWADQHKRKPIPSWETDPELYREWQEPEFIPGHLGAKGKDFRETSPLDIFVGNLLAGRAEFNWLVDIQFSSESTNQFNWSIGNLITAKHVLSTAHGFEDMIRDYDKPANDPTRRPVKRDGEIFFRTPADLFIAPQHTYPTYIRHGALTTWAGKSPSVRGEVGKYYNLTRLGVFEIEEVECGRRQSNSFFVHDKFYVAQECEFCYNFAILPLNFPVTPLLPVVGYMPIAMPDEVRLKIFSNDKQYLETAEKFRRLCYVASYGRENAGYAGDRFRPDIRDHKIRLRVYPTDWKKCVEAWKFFKLVLGHYKEALADAPLSDDMAQKVICFMARQNKTVCDHDRGAPLVCDGRVYGLVTRGTREENCSHRYPMPFIVVKTHELVSMYKNHLQQFYPSFGGSVKQLSHCSTTTVTFLLLLTSTLAAVFIRLLMR